MQGQQLLLEAVIDLTLHDPLNQRPCRHEGMYSFNRLQHMQLQPYQQEQKCLMQRWLHSS